MAAGSRGNGSVREKGGTQDTLGEREEDKGWPCHLAVQLGAVMSTIWASVCPRLGVLA